MLCWKVAALAGYERDVPIIDAKLSEPADRILIQELVTICRSDYFLLHNRCNRTGQIMNAIQSAMS